MPSVFGEFTLDPERRQLLRAGIPLSLEPKAYELLSLLVTRRPRAISKDQIHEVLWSGTFVSDSALAGLIADVRSVLGDDARRPRFIRTVHGFGYAFCGEARGDEQPAPTPSVANLGHAIGPGPDARDETDGSRQLMPLLPLPGRAHPYRKTRVAIVVAVIGVLGTVIGWRLVATRRETGVQLPPATLTRVTFDTGLQIQPTWSPDGRFIAYASDRSGNLDIWVQPLSGTQAVPVTNDPADDSAPAWSPDGQHLAFRSERQGGGIYLVGALGGGERRLAGFGYRPRWSPDGTRLLFSSGDGQQSFGFGKHVYVITVEETAPREVLASFFKDVWKSPSVAWHPDGERISVWAEHKTLGPGFWTARLPDGEPVLSEGSVQAIKDSYWFYWFTDFSWAPTGDALYFTAPALGAKVAAVQNVWRVGVDPATLRWTGQFTQLTNGPGPDAAAAISSDGKKIAFAGLHNETRLWTFAFDAAGRIEPDGKPLTAAGVVPLVWDISRDAKRLLTVRGRIGGAREAPELEELDLSTGARRILLRSVGPWSCLPAPPRWSPDTTRVAFVERTSNCDAGQTVLLDTQTGEQTRLPSVEGVRIFNVWDFSPDGQWVAVDVRRSLNDITELARLRIASDVAPRFIRINAAPSGMDVWDANFSPDGRWVSANVTPSVDAISFANVYVAPISGGPFVQVTDGTAFDGRVRWSPDGTMLYFLSTRGSSRNAVNVWAIRFDPLRGRPVGSPFRVTAFNSPARLIRPLFDLGDIRIARDHIVIPIMETSGNIWMLQNDR